MRSPTSPPKRLLYGIGALLLTAILAFGLFLKTKHSHSAQDRSLSKTPQETPKPVQHIPPPSEGLEKSDKDPEKVSGLALQLKKNAQSAADLVVSYANKPQLGTPATYHPVDNLVEIEICEWIAFAGLILANQGREPNEDSFFYKKYGFKVRLIMNETEDWDGLQTGKIAASICTVDTLTAWGPELEASCPLAFGWARFDDGLVTLSALNTLQEFAGKSFVVPHYTESDFMIRHVANHHGLSVYRRLGWEDPPKPDAINLLYATGVDDVGAIFEEDLFSGKGNLAGLVGWDPVTSEAVQKSKGRAKFFADIGLKVIGAEIQVFNRGFTKEYPEMVKGLIHGTLIGNQEVNAIKAGLRENPAALAVIARALTVNPDEPWTTEDVLEEFPTFEFANLNMNLGFLTDQMTKGGSFRSQFDSATEAYLLPDSHKAHHATYQDPQFARALSEQGPSTGLQGSQYKLHSVGVMARAAASVIDWSKLRFQFEPGIYNDLDAKQNAQALKALGQFLLENPQCKATLTGSLKLRDNASSEEERETANSASRLRAQTVGKALIKQYQLPESVITTTGAGRTPDGPIVTVQIKELTLE